MNPNLLTSYDCPNCGKSSQKNFKYLEGIIHICDRCDLQWATLFKSSAELDINITGVHDHYMSAESLGNPAEYPPYVDFFRYLERRGPLNSLKILDVGSGNGVFIGECLRRGIDAMGIEKDIRHSEIMSDKISSRIIFRPIEDLPALPPRFDVITFWDSFEHMEGAFDLLDSIEGNLNQNGIVFCRVNNSFDIFNLTAKIATYIAPFLGKRLIKVCFNLPQHVWNFSASSMISMLSRRGWTIVHSRFTDTPASRLFTGVISRSIIGFAYFINRAIGGGKIGEYWFVRTPPLLSRDSKSSL